MTVYKFANLDAWALKTRKRLDVVTKQATNDLLAGIEIAPGINRGGSRVKGTIPRDLGALASSLQSSLYGSSAMTQTGQASYALVAGSMEAGDVARFAWGGAVAPYAEHVHYGANGVPGTFWIDVAASKWPGYVKSAVVRAKAQVAG